MEEKTILQRLSAADKVLVGLGEEWKLAPDADEGRQAKVMGAYDALYELLKEKDYFIITMATDAQIYGTRLGSREERVVQAEPSEEQFSCSADEKTLALMDQIFPPKKRISDTRDHRIVAPCGNETWRQCSHACTKDIWEPGEIPDDICPHCGAPLTGNTREAAAYIEEGYLPQWNHYTRWLAGSWNQELLILELGVGFADPGVIRFPFEKTAFFNRKAYLVRVHARFPQTAEELKGRSRAIRESSLDFILGNNGKCQNAIEHY